MMKPPVIIKYVFILYSKPYLCFLTLSRNPDAQHPTLIRLFYKLINSHVSYI